MVFWSFGKFSGWCFWGARFSEALDSFLGFGEGFLGSWKVL